ncbi:MAG: hypothetical protein ACKVOP_14535 [Sphingomonadaceae bacterium]
MRCLPILLALLAFAMPQLAFAQVTVSFYSRAETFWFPHAFFTVKGTLERGGPEIDTNYGYTAKSIDAAVLKGAVDGRMDVATPAYIAKSRKHFSVVIPDATYDKLMALVEEWRSRPKGYDLNRNNCVHFVGYAAQIVGLNVNFENGYIKRPQAFLAAVTKDNATWFAARRDRAAVAAR